MPFKLYSRFFILTLTCGLLYTMTPNANAEDFSQKDIEKIVREYIENNPEILVKSLENYRNKQEQEKLKLAAISIEEHLPFLTDKAAPSIGNPDAKITVVEFFDYNCGYCKRALPDLQEVVKENDNVRVVFQELPILSPASREASKWALAAHKQGKYIEYHAALMQHGGVKNERTFTKLAEKTDLDVEKMKKDAQAPETSKMLDRIALTVRDIGVRGTPAFIINGELYRGYLGSAGFKSAISKAQEDLDNKEG